jgi:hypothetical protein
VLQDDDGRRLGIRRASSNGARGSIAASAGSSRLHLAATGYGRLRPNAVGCVKVDAYCELVADVDLEVDAHYDLVEACDLDGDDCNELVAAVELEVDVRL